MMDAIVGIQQQALRAAIGCGLLMMMLVDPACGQTRPIEPPAGDDPIGQIRDETQRIMSRPEFRFFRRLDRESDGPFGDGNGSSRRTRSGRGRAGEQQGVNRENGGRDQPGDRKLPFQDGNGLEPGDAGGGGNEADPAGAGGEGRRWRWRFWPGNDADANRPNRPNPRGIDDGPGDAGDWDLDSPDTSWGSFDPGNSAFAGLGSTLGTVFEVIAWIFLGIIAAVIIYLVTRAILDRQQTEKPLDIDEADHPFAATQAPGMTPADVYLKRARELAQAGRFRDAIVQLLLGAMSDIERSGLLQFRQGLTLRDYLRSVRGQDKLFQALRQMVRVYEPVGFGRREATRKHYELTLAGYQAGFHGVEAASQT